MLGMNAIPLSDNCLATELIEKLSLFKIKTKSNGATFLQEIIFSPLHK